MISAQNHLQPLSGSKLFLVLAMLCLFTLSYGQRERKLYRGKDKDKDVLRFDVDSNANKGNIQEEQKNSKEEEREKVREERKEEKESKTLQTKELYKVAVILPFNYEVAWSKMSRVSSSMPDTASRTFDLPKETQIAIEFYRGVQMALKGLPADTKDLQVNIYDDKKSEATTKELLAMPEMKEMDLIIGPTYNQNAKLVADFCKQNKIYNFLPFSPSKSITSSNPYHFKLNPTIEMHLKAIANHLLEKYHGGKIILMIRPVPEERALASMMMQYVDVLNTALSADAKISIDSISAGSDKSKLAITDLMDAKKQNFVVVPTFNEAFANDMGHKFAGIKQDNISFYGMPTWTDYEAVKLEYLNKAQTHFTQVVFPDTTNADLYAFQTKFESTYHYVPTENNYLGYDVMNFAYHALKKYGLSIKDHFDEIDERGIATNFRFQPSKYVTSDNSLNFDIFENSQLHFLMLQNYQMVQEP